MTPPGDPSREPPRGLILYDGDCGFCRWTLARLLAWDRTGALRPVAIQSEEGQELLAAITPERRLASWHFVSADGVLSSAGAAVAPLLRGLPGGRPLALLAGLFPALTDAGYRLVAAHRSKLGGGLTVKAKRRATRGIEQRETLTRPACPRPPRPSRRPRRCRPR